ncbi:MAG TPA: S-methyl-5-thioribose-1-phosphate isomerase [Myxococcota bacterium]|nr:S-methyl-5-thioribose-1-phosphate isomerase [Myxococcota bacterium]
MTFSTVRWEDGEVVLLDQRRLPAEETYLHCRTASQVAAAIRDMAVRGAPAIGVTAAFGAALAAREILLPPNATWPQVPLPSWVEEYEEACEGLAAARPTAVNLAWALGRMRALAKKLAAVEPRLNGERIYGALVDEAGAIAADDLARCRAIGRWGEPLVPPAATLLTHCNAGALATAGYGTALGVVRAAAAAGKQVRVLAGETRPFLQGSRLTAWELLREGIPVTVITDSMAGSILGRGEVDLVVVGADRIAANGDVANKIGTYPLAVMAARHGVPFYVAAPLSTVDLSLAHGGLIPIEERAAEEVLTIAGVRVAAAGATARHPAFDVTPAELVTAIVTEAGVLRPPYAATLAAAMGPADASYGTSR